MVCLLVMLLGGAAARAEDDSLSPPAACVPAPLAPLAPLPPAAPPAPFVEASNAFAFDLYGPLAADKVQTGRNVFFSPYSITTALAMVAEGAREETAAEMGAVLRYPASWRRTGETARPWDEAPLHTGLADLARRFAQRPVGPELQARIDTLRQQCAAETAAAEQMTRGTKPDWAAYRAQVAKARQLQGQFDAAVGELPGYELSVANALWAERTYAFAPDYLASITQHYTARIAPADFVHQPDAARLEINDWIAHQTKERIKDMLKPRALDDTTRLVLVNAIYFLGTWREPFAPAQTQPAEFASARGKERVPMMNHRGLKEGSYAAFEGDGRLFPTPERVSQVTKREECYPSPAGFLVAELPYQGDGLAMTILLPQSPDGLPALEKLATAAHLREWTDQLVPRAVNVALPKFTFKTTYRLNEALGALGMPRAFSPFAAQFGGMSPTKELYIGFVQHDAFVEVNEKGTEAAAATVVAMLAGGAPSNDRPFVPVFCADRPFLFLIRDRTTGLILFLGRVYQPES